MQHNDAAEFFRSRPLVVAPMAGGPSSPELVCAAAAHGAFGFLAAGYKTADQLTEQMRAAAQSGPYGVNFFALQPQVDAETVRTHLLHYVEVLAPEFTAAGVEPPAATALAAVDPTDAWDAKCAALRDAWSAGFGPAAVSVTFGLPTPELIAAGHAAGALVLATVADPVAAQKAAALGVDALVVQGPGAGGHRATLTVEEEPSAQELPQLVAAVNLAVQQTTAHSSAQANSPVRGAGDNETGRQDVGETSGPGSGQRADPIPLIVAGGVSTPSAVAQALAWPNVVAVAAGTAFLLADEAGTNPTYRAGLREAISAAAPTTAVTRAFSGRVARGISNRFLAAYSAAAPALYPYVNTVTGPLRAAATREGRADALSLWAGTGFAAAKEAPAAEIIDYLLSELAPSV